MELPDVVSNRLREISRRMALELLLLGDPELIESTRASLESSVSRTILELEEVRGAISVLSSGNHAEK